MKSNPKTNISHLTSTIYLLLQCLCFAFRLTIEAVVRRCSVKKVFLEISQNSQENTCARVSLLIKLQASRNFIKQETLPQVFSCEFCETSKNTFFTEHFRTTTSVINRTVSGVTFIIQKQAFKIICKIIIQLFSSYFSRVMVKRSTLQF